MAFRVQVGFRQNIFMALIGFRHISTIRRDDGCFDTNINASHYGDFDCVRFGQKSHF